MCFFLLVAFVDKPPTLNLEINVFPTKQIIMIFIKLCVVLKLIIKNNLT